MNPDYNRKVQVQLNNYYLNQVGMKKLEPGENWKMFIGNFKGFFQEQDDEYQYAAGVVELSNGCVVSVNVSLIKFFDIAEGLDESTSN